LFQYFQAYRTDKLNRVKKVSRVNLSARISWSWSWFVSIFGKAKLLAKQHMLYSMYITVLGINWWRFVQTYP
jgi:hypothetical protein